MLQKRVSAFFMRVYSPRLSDVFIAHIARVFLVEAEPEMIQRGLELVVVYISRRP